MRTSKGRPFFEEKMKIGLHDADAEHIKNKTFPNYALMKIAAYHKSLGDTVEWWNPLYKYDKVYSSKIFDFTEENPYIRLLDNVIYGGTGYSIDGKLPREIEDMYPDYSIYPSCDYAIGFITRGCPNNCAWCLVPQKEGNIMPYRTWRELTRSDTNKLVLMDNNILASPFGIEQLRSMIDSGIKLDLNQGMDIRFVSEDIVKIFKELKWIRFIRFSCDSLGQLLYFERVLKWFEKYKVGTSKVFVYVLVQKDLNNADYRVQALNKINKNIHIYAQAERNEKKGIVPNKMQLEFAQRYVYGRLYRREDWNQYCRRKGFK